MRETREEPPISARRQTDVDARSIKSLPFVVAASILRRRRLFSSVPLAYQITGLVDGGMHRLDFWDYPYHVRRRHFHRLHDDVAMPTSITAKARIDEKGLIDCFEEHLNTAKGQRVDAEISAVVFARIQSRPGRVPIIVNPPAGDPSDRRWGPTVMRRTLNVPHRLGRRACIGCGKSDLHPDDQEMQEKMTSLKGQTVLR
jgi:hypothetical protein